MLPTINKKLVRDGAYKSLIEYEGQNITAENNCIDRNTKQNRKYKHKVT
jgi:hypothetical protein